MNGAKEPNHPPERGRLRWPAQPWLAGAILALLVAIVYWPTLDGGFVAEDGDFLVDNPAMRSLQGLSDIWFKLDTCDRYYPLTFSTFWIEYRLWGPEPRGYHAVNVVLQAVVAVLVWRLLSRLAVPGAWLAAAIFAVHPVHVESVAPMAELRNLLSFALVLGSLLAYFRFLPPEAPIVADANASPVQAKWGYYALSLGLYIASLLAKTITVSAPAVLLVIYWWKRGRLTWRDAARTVPFFAVGLALCGITLWVEKTYWGASGPEWSFSPLERVLIAGRALWFYAGKLFWPHPLIWFYPRWVVNVHLWWQYLFPATALAVIAGLWLARSRIGRGPLAGVLIFGGVLVPVLGFFYMATVRLTFVADHFQYHATIALIALAVATAVTAAGRLPRPARWLGLVAGAGLILSLAAVAQQRTHAWKNELTLMNDLVAQDPQSWAGRWYLVMCLISQGKYGEASPHIRKSIEILEQLVRDNPTIGDYQSELAGMYVNFGFHQLQMGRGAESESAFRQAIEIRQELVRDHPTVSEHRASLATSYEDLAISQQSGGQGVEAAASRRQAIEIRQRLAQDYPTIGKYQDNLAASYVDVGVFQQGIGQWAEAENSFRQAIEIRQKLVRDNPTVSDYQEGLAWCYVDLALAQRQGGRPADAEASHREAIKIREKLAHGNSTVSKYKNSVAASYADLGLVERDAGRPVEAQSAFHKAIEIREKLVRDHPVFAEYQASLAASYEDLAILQQTCGRAADAADSRRQAIEIREKMAQDNGVLTVAKSLGKLEFRQKLAQDNLTLSKYQDDFAASYVDAGLVELDIGRPADAQIAFRDAIEIREKLVQDHPTTSRYQDGLAWCYVDLALALHQTGRAAEAQACYSKAIEVREKLVQDNPARYDYKHQLALSYRDFGNLQRATGRIVEAVASQRKAIEIRQELAIDYPADAACQANLATDLALGGDALALLGQWTESADLYAQAVPLGNYSWQTMGLLALVQLAAGNEGGYRVTCTELVKQHAGNTAPDAAFAIALTLVVGDKALDNMNSALALAMRAADADPSNTVTTIVVGAAQYRTGRGQEAIATLAQALSQLDPAVPAAAARPNQFLVARLVGAMILALAYYEQADSTARQQQLAILRALIDDTKTPGAAQHQGDLPPWAVGFAIEIAKRTMAQLSGSAGQGR